VAVINGAHDDLVKLALTDFKVDEGGNITTADGRDPSPSSWLDSKR
jgi:hypothetical protein